MPKIILTLSSAYAKILVLVLITCFYYLFFWLNGYHFWSPKHCRSCSSHFRKLSHTLIHLESQNDPLSFKMSSFIFLKLDLVTYFSCP